MSLDVKKALLDIDDAIDFIAADIGANRLMVQHFLHHEIENRQDFNKMIERAKRDPNTPADLKQALKKVEPVNIATVVTSMFWKHLYTLNPMYREQIFYIFTRPDHNKSLEVIHSNLTDKEISEITDSEVKVEHF